MEENNGDEIYHDWLAKWRKWKHAWCNSDELLVAFSVRAIAKNRTYSEDDHADLANQICKFTGSKVSINKAAEILCHVSPSVTSVLTVTTPGKRRPACDRLGVVTFQLSFFTRKNILKVALALEFLGHGVIHDNGRVVSNEYDNSCSANIQQKMPHRDDPIWAMMM